MRRILVTLAAVAFLVGALAAPVAAATPFIDVSQDKGSSAYADRGSCTEDSPDVGDSTCEYTYASVNDGWSRYNGERFSGKTLCVGFGTSVYDASEQTYTDSLRSGCLEDADVSIDRSLASASAAGTVPTESVECVYDVVADTYECTDPVPADVAVVLDWTGIPPVSQSTSRSRDQYGDCTSTYFSKGSWSEATASGTFDGGTASFDWAQINSGKSRFTYSCHQ